MELHFGRQTYKLQIHGWRYYDYQTDSAGLSLGAEDDSRTKSPIPLGGPMLHRAVLCVKMASFIF